jgi:hypothetical protein
MKLAFSAIALAFAVPAAGQTGPAHTYHSQHHESGHQAPGSHGEHPMPKSDAHKGHAMKDGCCADKDGNGKMDCCEKMAATKSDEPSAKPQGQ